MSAYWIAQVTVTDPDAYAGYQALAREAFAPFGGEFLARGGVAETKEGPAYARHVVIRFPDMARFKGMIETAGFVRVTAEPILGGLVAIHSGWKI